MGQLGEFQTDFQVHSSWNASGKLLVAAEKRTLSVRPATDEAIISHDLYRQKSGIPFR